MNRKPRQYLVILSGAILALTLTHSAVALNPQPEVPSKEQGKSKPRALNPQPEVPSKAKGKTNPRALNPQPEVPSKDKKKKSKAAEKKSGPVKQ